MFDQFGDIAYSENFYAFIIYGKPQAVTVDIRQQQNTYIWLCLALQLVAIMIVCATSYGPLNGLLLALESRGFLRVSDRPTVLKVIRMYCIEPVVEFKKDPRGG